MCATPATLFKTPANKCHCKDRGGSLERKKAGQRQLGAAVLVGRCWKVLEETSRQVGAHIVGAPVYSVPGHTAQEETGIRIMQTSTAGEVPRGLLQRLRRSLLKLALKQP